MDTDKRIKYDVILARKAGHGMRYIPSHEPERLQKLDYLAFVSVFADYDLIHTNSPMTLNCREVIHGACDANERKIWISTNQTHEEKLRTIIHEALHAHYIMHEIRRSEGEIRREASELLRMLRGL